MAEGLAVLIPSYDRPEILIISLPGWLRAVNVAEVFIVAEASSRDKLRKYEEVLERYEESGKLVYRLHHKRLGSVRARNTLLEMFVDSECDYAIMADDDYLLVDERSLEFMVEDFKLSDEIGMVGGRVVIARRRREDPDFFLNSPAGLADLLTRLTGYVFLDVEHGPRYAEFLPHFFAIRKDIVKRGIRYDASFDTPTGFREESDFQQQVKRLGYKLLFDPRAYVIHLAVEEGGDRPSIGMSRRIYWKARNHAAFILKWHKSRVRRLWYLTLAGLMLAVYRPKYFTQVFRGLKHGVCSFWYL